MISRRQFIVGITVTSTASLAGCSGNGTSTDDNEPTTDSESDDASSDASGSDTGDNTDNVSDGQGEPEAEAALEKYLTARVDGDVETANEVLHSESPLYPIEELEGTSDVTINEITEITPEEWVEQRSGDGLNESETQAQVENVQDQLETIQADLGVDNSTIVIASWVRDEEERSQQYVLIQDDGNWFVYTG